ncbi:MAG: DUF2961 domain-containing protein [Planctomycetes bacterium]|nr:DUF2961 domain-containing protein [Planctomycetota bacterium]
MRLTNFPLLLALIAATFGCASKQSDLPGIELARLKHYRSARVSSTDPTGGNADYRAVEPGETLVLADIDGPGAITHLWFTFGPKEKRNQLILRAYWDNEPTPSIAAPLGVFFGAGHADGRVPFYNNAYFDISPQLGLNCHLPMPFRAHAKLTLTNISKEKFGSVYYYVDYVQAAVPPDAAYLCANYQSENPCKIGGDYIFAEGTGEGHIVGVHLAVEANADGWWGEGDDKITIDGVPIMQGTGTEDYFCGAWDFGAEHAGLYQGSPRLEPEKKGAKHDVYRFYRLDPIPFHKNFRYAIEHGHANDRADAWASVAYWYQMAPHAPVNDPWKR